MPALRFRLPGPVVEAPDWDGLRAELKIGELGPEVEAAGQLAASKPLPDVEDQRDIPFITLDPAGSTDLDQAMHLAKNGDGYTVNYAIADVAHFVSAGDALDVWARKQGQTFYGPDKKIPLYPFAISQGAGSLLPGQDRPSVLWTIQLDRNGEILDVNVRRALVRSRQQFAYEGEIDQNNETFALLAEIGTLRQQIARQHDAVDLPSPEQLVDQTPSGPVIRFRATTPLEMYNSQISLLTGIAAAGLMLGAEVGMLRTLPKADEEGVRSLRLSADALGISWPDGASYGDVVSAIDVNTPNALAFLNLAARLLRGASYESFDGEAPKHSFHSGVGAPYAHCTAPLRRLADRYVNEACIAICAGTVVPQWVRDAPPQLPKEMSSSDQRAHGLSRAVIEAAEAFVMSAHIGKQFEVEVVAKPQDEKRGSVQVQLAEPAVRADCEVGETQVELGQRISVRCTEADVKARKVRFSLVG